jgi:hypothetical protein
MKYGFVLFTDPSAQPREESSMETRQDCEGKFGKELNECLARLETLEARKDQAPDPAAYARELDALKKRHQEVWEKYQKMKTAGEDEWSGHRKTIGSAIIAIQQALDESFSRFHR